MDALSEIIRISSVIIQYTSQGLECLLVIFLTSQYLKKKSNFKSAYFVILNIGYIFDIILLITWIISSTTWLTFTSPLYSFLSSMQEWYIMFFITIWNVILCLNRCTALIFYFKYDKAILTGNISYQILKNPDFLAFLKLLRPSYKVPSRDYTLSKKLIPKEYEEMHGKIQGNIEKSSSLSLSFDGWTDVTGRPIMNIIVHNPKPYLYKFIDVSDDRETGEYVAEKIIEIIQELGPQKVAGVDAFVS